MTTKTFLLVEDDSDDTELFTEAIGAVDASVLCYSAADGREALAKLNAKSIGAPDLIFLDINMPGMNGWQLLNRLKSDQSYKDIPVIMYSTSSQIKDIKNASASGALCFFTKPNSFLKLKKILEVVVSCMERNALDAVCDAVHSL
jgi:CheY-like chemotaxis protein